MKRILAILTVMIIGFSGIQVYGEEAFTENESELIYDVSVAENSTIDIGENDPEKNDNANSWRFNNGVPIENKADISNNFKAGKAASALNATAHGIDVSEWQGNINWEKVKSSGIDFAILRCGFGMNQTDQDDSKFLKNAKECERLGIPYGVYIYSYATNTSRADSEADHVLRLLKGRTLSYPVYFDMEDSSTLAYKSSFGKIAETFCNKINAAGYPVGVYANLNWWNNYLTDSCFDKWYKWVAQYYHTCEYKKEYAMWQYSSSGKVNGIAGNVDMNYLIGYPADHGSKAVEVEEGTYTLSNKAKTNSILSIKDAGVENNVAAEIAIKENIGSNNRFEIIGIGNKKYKILAEHSGKALDIKDSNKEPGAELQQYQWHEAAAQIWQFESSEDGYYYLRSNLGTYLQYDSSKPNSLVTATYNKSDAQKWKLNASDYRPIKNGIYSIFASADENKCLDIKNSSVEDRVSVGINNFNNYISQQFSVTYEDEGYYRITAEHSGKVFDVVNGSKEPGVEVQQYVSNGSNAQLWKFVEDGQGNYYLKSKLGTTVSAGSKSSVHMGVMDFSTGQKWNVKPYKLSGIKDGIYSFKSRADTSYSLTQSDEKIRLYGFENILEQKYRIEKISGDYYRIVDIATGLVLDVENASKAAGANLQVHKWNGTDAQLWRFAKISDGNYVIKSKLGTFISAVSISENGKVNLAYFSNRNNQKWTLESEKLVYGNKPQVSADENISRVFGSESLVRFAGKDRYETAFMVADALKKSMDSGKFDNIVIASGNDYPDALSGGYLAAKKNAPVILINDYYKEEAINYIKRNINSRGTVYILGGKAVVSSNIEKDLKKFTSVKRLYGKDRYETNLAVLKESGIKNENIIVCSGRDFADSLSASSLGKPILLVNDRLTNGQEIYLHDIEVSGVFLIGGVGAVNENIEQECKKYSDTIRIAGMNRYTTSVAVARAFFGDWNKAAVLVDGSTFPDGLSGGPLATSIQSPVLLVNNINCNAAEEYYEDMTLKKAAVMGGETLISNDIVEGLVNLY
ncbi:cell wall-binding repeat-containing protein [Lentihominibacter sp.]|uniref:cell wall-binding repeat-containing protein n=1 Tax=Lentihominibacter sp. TaxID=2944216 RepID=UPI0015A4EF6E